MASILKIAMRAPDDFHVHLREGELLKEVAGQTARIFKRALVMPNLSVMGPIINGNLAERYEAEILKATEGTGFKPLMTIKLTQSTREDMIRSAKRQRVVAAKLYPEGVTTNSSGGVSDPDQLQPVFKAMAREGMVLCIHGEEPGAFCLSREKIYLTRVAKILNENPTLKVVLEHITTKDAVDFVKSSNTTNLAATITPHHLCLTLDDVVGDQGLRPHNFCKPIAKLPSDCRALFGAATSGSGKFFLGTDSAPHTVEKKECDHGCAGCYNAPTAVELLATLFDNEGQLGKLEPFMSEYGAKFYGLGLNEETILLERSDWLVPAVYGTKKSTHVIPFNAGQLLSWKATAEKLDRKAQ